MNSQYLKSLRALEDITQEQMASLLDMSIQTYNKKENGKVPFLATELKTIAEFFGVPMENFFTKEVVSTTTIITTA